MIRPLRHAAALFGATSMLFVTAAALAEPVSVTRFHRADIEARTGEPVAVVAAPGTDGDSLENRLWLEAVASALTASRFGMATPGAASLIAEVRVESFTRPVGDRRGPVNVGVGGSTGGWHSGFGLGLGFNLGGKRAHPESQTRLAVIIRDRVSGQTLWEGRAETAFDPRSRGADPANLSHRMARALIAGFPGRSGETIAVK